MLSAPRRRLPLPQIVDFAELSALIDPEDLVEMLNTVFSRFDELVEAVGAYKVETVGPVYMVAAGVPQPSKLHCATLARLALLFNEAVEGSTTVDDTPLRLKLGL